MGGNHVFSFYGWIFLKKDKPKDKQLGASLLMVLPMLNDVYRKQSTLNPWICEVHDRHLELP